MGLQDFLAEEMLEFTDKDIGEFLISIITGGLYIEPHLILREYIQNAHDAIIAWEDAPEVGRVDIKIEPPNIHIIDNGPGMSRDELRAAMSKVGISSKPFGAATGFMGIGKLAGLSMAERVRIDSSKYGQPGRNWVAFNAGDMLNAIEERRRRGESRPIVETLKDHSRMNKNVMAESAEAHYTAVHLLGIRDDYWKAINKRDEFLKKLGLVAPVRQDPNFVHADVIEELLESIAPEHYYSMEMYVDGVPLYRPYYDDVMKPRGIEVLDEDGNQLAYGWACQHKESEQIPDPLLRGIALLQRGIAVGERRLAEDLGLYGTSPSDYIYFRWYIGEIYITDTEILLTANRMSLRRNTRAIEFLQRVKQELRKLRNAAAKFSQRDNAIKKAPQHIRAIQEIALKISDESLSAEMVPSTVQKIVRARDDLKKRRRHLPEDVKRKATRAINTADDLLKQLTEPPPRDELVLPSPRGQTEQPPTEVSDIVISSQEDITVAEEEFRATLSISGRLGFSSRERRIFQLIIGAIADVSGGKDTEEFARYLQRIEEVLYAELGTHTERRSYTSVRVD